MDVLYFLKDRTRLIRQYYEQAAQPLNEIIRKIEANEDPFIPPYSEDGEPPFQAEWADAQELLEVTGRCCVSMLSASLQLYFRTWERELGLRCGIDFKATFNSDGMIAGYRLCLAERLGIDWSNCPADLTIIEQIVLARNCDQHPESITTLRVTHTERDRARHPRPFFLNEREAALFEDDEGLSSWMLSSLHISRDKLMTAIANVETLCEWLEDKMFEARYPSRHERTHNAIDDAPPNPEGKSAPA